MGCKGKSPEGKNFRKLLRRKQSSAKISEMSRNTLKTSKSDIFYLLRSPLKYLLQTFFFLPRSFQKFLPFAFLPSGSFRNMAPKDYSVYASWGPIFFGGLALSLWAIFMFRRPKSIIQKIPCGPAALHS